MRHVDLAPPGERLTRCVSTGRRPARGPAPSSPCPQLGTRLQPPRPGWNQLIPQPLGKPVLRRAPLSVPLPGPQAPHSLDLHRVAARCRTTRQLPQTARAASSTSPFSSSSPECARVSAPACRGAPPADCTTAACLLDSHPRRARSQCDRGRQGHGSGRDPRSVRSPQHTPDVLAAVRQLPRSP